MKKKITFFYLIGMLMFMAIHTHAQVGINADRTPPDPSAGLEVKYTDKGFLPPRMTLQERDAISSPANGLMVICTNCSIIGSLCIFFSGSGWITVSPCSTPAPVAGTHVPSGTQIIWNWTAVPNATGYKWNTTNDYNTATDILTSTSRTETGLAFCANYTRYIWAYFACGTSEATIFTESTSYVPVDEPAAGTDVLSLNQIIWNWNTVPNAGGYKWNTTNDFNTATDMGTNTSKTETGLTNGNTYTRYVWAYNTCGESAATSLNKSLFYPGMSYQGGLFFYLYQPGDHGYVAGQTHGLIASPWDQGVAVWGDSTTTWTGGTNPNIGYGQANTTAIINGCNWPYIAAAICANLDLDGYSDWFLPSLYELDQLSAQKYVLSGFTQIETFWYWSSSEAIDISGVGCAYANDFRFNGGTSYAPKSENYAVRPVRAF